MSYTSESVLSESATLAQVQEVVKLLGYRKTNDGLAVPSRVASYRWFDERDYRSFVGVELDVYQCENGRLTVTTRSTVARSYWDLSHQNTTLKLIRDLLGGYFTTDAGRNRYWRPDEPPPTPLASGCFVAQWRFHDDLGRAHIYLMSRNLEGQIAGDLPSGVDITDSINPRLLSNNLLVPFIVGVWEEYFRATFAAIVRYANEGTAALKRIQIAPTNLQKVLLGVLPLERAVAESLSFQRPSSIVENYSRLDRQLDIAGALRKPYRQRKVSLFDSIEKLVEDRNEFVHTGGMNMALYDKRLKRVLADMEVAVLRAYKCVAVHYGFVPSLCYPQ